MSTNVTSAATMPEKTQQRFGAELDKLQASSTSGPRDRVVQIIGLVLAVAGAAVSLLCYAQAAGFDDLRDQVQVSILAIFGLGLVVLGTGLYVANALTRFLRLWMLRLIYEQRDAGR
jgi:hypothetical protein